MAEDYLARTACCGLYCGDCSFGQGTIPDLARDLRKELRDTRFSELADVIPFPEFKNYQQCYDVLGAMVKLRCKGSRGGSRSKFCNIAKCAIKKEYAGCWECEDFSSCTKLVFLVPVHGDAHLKNLRSIKKSGVDAFAQGKRLWYSPPGKK